MSRFRPLSRLWGLLFACQTWHPRSSLRSLDSVSSDTSCSDFCRCLLTRHVESHAIGSLTRLVKSRSRVWLPVRGHDMPTDSCADKHPCDTGTAGPVADKTGKPTACGISLLSKKKKSPPRRQTFRGDLSLCAKEDDLSCERHDDREDLLHPRTSRHTNMWT